MPFIHIGSRLVVIFRNDLGEFLYNVFSLEWILRIGEG